MKKSKGTTQIGFVKRNGQVVIRNTSEPGMDFGATTYQVYVRARKRMLSRQKKCGGRRRTLFKSFSKSSPLLAS